MNNDVNMLIKKTVLDAWGKYADSIEFTPNDVTYILEIRDNGDLVVRNGDTGKEYLVGHMFRGNKHALINYVIGPTWSWGDDSWHEIIHDALCCIGAKESRVAWDSELEKLKNEDALWYVLNASISYLNALERSGRLVGR